MSNYNPNGTYTELLDAIAQGHNVTAEHLAQAKERDTARAEADAQAAQIARDIAAAHDQRAANRAAHDQEHQPILADMLEELDIRRAARDAAAVPLREAKAAYQATHQAAADQYRQIARYIGEHYGNARFEEGEDTPVFDTYLRFGSLVVAGEPVPNI